MKIHKRLDRLEQKFISEPTILFTPDGKTVSLTGPNDYLLTLFGLTMHPERAPTQAGHLNLIRKCVNSKEPCGARIVELIHLLLCGAGERDTRNGADGQAMNAILRRLSQLEFRLVPKVDHRLAQAAAVLGERRRRRLEASGLPMEEELDWSSLSVPPGTRLSSAETLRLALRLRRERARADRETGGAERTAP